MDTTQQLLALLTDEEARWLFDAGLERRLLPGEILYCVGDTLDHLYIVLEGFLRAYTVHSDGKPDLSAEFGPANIIGESSWISGKPVLETIEAGEEALVLAIPTKKLSHKIINDVYFRAHFMQAVSGCMAERLHESFNTIAQLRRQGGGASTPNIADPKARLDLAVGELKRSLIQADKAALANGGEIPRNIEEQTQEQFRDFCIRLNITIGDASTLPASLKEEIGAMVQQELLPYLSMADSDRWYSKPRGYAGDYITITKMNANQPAGSGRLGPLVDRCFLAQPAAAAVRNRRNLFRKHIEATVDSASLMPVRVMSLASGPALELFDAYGNLSRPDVLHSYLVDMDAQALAYVAEKRDQQNLTQIINLYNNNLVYLARGKERIEVPPQNLVYSIGLSDYFNDELVVSLINFVFDVLIPGGKLILGNFHPRNTDKAIMDHVLEWRLIHRSEEDMDRLFLCSRFGRGCSDIRFEEEGINLFAECIKS